MTSSMKNMDMKDKKSNNKSINMDILLKILKNVEIAFLLKLDSSISKVWKHQMSLKKDKTNSPSARKHKS